MSAASKSLATAETLLALGDEPYEVIAGELVPKPAASGEHSDAQSWVAAILKPAFQRSHELYRRHGVPHYWIVDPEGTLTVYRLTPDGYLVALVAGRDAVVRAEPFEAIELRVGVLSGDE